MNSVKGKIIAKCVILMSRHIYSAVFRFSLIYTLMECKVKSVSKLLPLNSIKLNLNLVTKLKLLSTVNITNIDINIIFS